MRALQGGDGLICGSSSGPERRFRGLFKEVVGLPTLCSHAVLPRWLHRQGACEGKGVASRADPCSPRFRWGSV